MSRAEVMERAKELFLRYAGNRFYMDLDGRGGEYEIFRVPKETEDLWAEELVRGLRSSKKRGREALGEYSAAAQLARRLWRGAASDLRTGSGDVCQQDRQDISARPAFHLLRLAFAN